MHGTTYSKLFQTNSKLQVMMIMMLVSFFRYFCTKALCIFSKIVMYKHLLNILLNYSDSSILRANHPYILRSLAHMDERKNVHIKLSNTPHLSNDISIELYLYLPLHLVFALDSFSNDSNSLYSQCECKIHQLWVSSASHPPSCVTLVIDKFWR